MPQLKVVKESKSVKPGSGADKHRQDAKNVDMMQISVQVPSPSELWGYSHKTMAGILEHTGLEHTSDAAIWTEGTSKKELFADALWQMSDLLLPGHCQKIAHYDCLMRVRMQAVDDTALLIDFLSEALALTYIQKALFCHVYFDLLTDKKLSARLYGRWYDQLANEIKAVTYHEAEITRAREGRWATPVLFDL